MCEEQDDLFDNTPKPARLPEWLRDKGRDTAPFQPHSDTSREAADKILPTLNRLQAEVLERLRESGREGMTDEEQQTALAMNPSTQRPRRIELVARGLVTQKLDRSGEVERRDTKSGRGAVVWVAVLPSSWASKRFSGEPTTRRADAGSKSET